MNHAGACNACLPRAAPGALPPVLLMNREGEGGHGPGDLFVESS